MDINVMFQAQPNTRAIQSKVVYSGNFTADSFSNLGQYQAGFTQRLILKKWATWPQPLPQTERHADNLIQNQHYQEVIRSLVKRYVAAMIRSAKTDEGLTEENFKELKQDISSFRYEVLDLLGNRKAPHRTYSPNSEGTHQDEPAEPEEQKQESRGDVGNRCGHWGRSSRSKASTSFTQSYRGGGSHFSVSALFKSMSGMERQARARPEINGLGKDVSSSLVRTSNRLHRFSSSKKNSLQRFGTMMSRMNGHLPDPQQSAYSISDRVPQADWCGPQALSELTRSELHLHTLGLRSTETELQSTSQQANGTDSLFLGHPGHSLHRASGLTASSARLLASSDGLCQSWMGHCDSFGSSSWEQEESVTTQL